MGSNPAANTALDNLEELVLQEVIQYCADCGMPPTDAALNEAIESAREKSGPHVGADPFPEVEQRVRLRLSL
ncbi:MAG: hypothetical protein ABR565_05065 [Gammaproteobacteria bacterium]